MTFEELKDRCNARSEGAHPIREGKRVSHPEDRLQMQCVSWFRDSFPELAPLLFHPNNEAYFGGRGKTELQRRKAGKRAKDMGITPGVADLVLLFPASGYHGLMVEMKSKTGQQEESQKTWQKAVEAHGYKYTLCRSLTSFKVIVKEYTGIHPRDQDEIAVERLFGKGVRIRRNRKTCE